jgi:hypothetical protein
LQVRSTTKCLKTWVSRHILNLFFTGCYRTFNILYGLAVRAPGYRSRGPAFRFPALPDFPRKGPLSLVSTIEAIGRQADHLSRRSLGLQSRICHPSLLPVLHH